MDDIQKEWAIWNWSTLISQFFDASNTLYQSLVYIHNQLFIYFWISRNRNAYSWNLTIYPGLSNPPPKKL